MISSALFFAPSAAAPPAQAVGTGTVAASIIAYRKSQKWLELAPGTREGYGRHLDFLRDEYGAMPAAGFRHRHVEEPQQRFASQPRKANYLTAVMRLLFNHGIRLEMITANPAAKTIMVHTEPRREMWSRDDEADFLAVADPRLHLAFMLMLYTTQRLSDVLAMTKGRVYERDGRIVIELRQQKTGELVAVAAHRNLVPLLRARLADPAGGLLLVPSPRGRPWARRNFSRKWDDSMEKMAKRRAIALGAQGWSEERVAAELEAQHRQRRDLRRTGIVRMAEAGVTTPQIAAASGHGIDYCSQSSTPNLPRRTEVAIAGIDAWEAGEKRAPRNRVVRLSTGKSKPR